MIISNIKSLILRFLKLQLVNFLLLVLDIKVLKPLVFCTTSFHTHDLHCDSVYLWFLWRIRSLLLVGSRPNWFWLGGCFTDKVIFSPKLNIFGLSGCALLYLMMIIGELVGSYLGLLYRGLGPCLHRICSSTVHLVLIQIIIHFLLVLMVSRFI